MYSLSDTVVLITGAAKGIGAGVVRLLLEEGAKHVTILDVDEKAGVAFQDELNAQYGADRARFHACDVTSNDQLFDAFSALMTQYGRLDLVINNAGILNDQAYQKEIDINVTALITSSLKALEIMRKDTGGAGGTVINISSIAGLAQIHLMPVYCATKAAVIQFSNCVGKQEYFEKTGVRVLTVCFGVTDTSLIVPTNVGSFDENIKSERISGAMNALHVQRLESAAKGVIDTYKQGASGSTWIATRDLPVRDITDNITKAYKLMGEFN